MNRAKMERVPQMAGSSAVNFAFVNNDEEVSITARLTNASIITIMVTNETGTQDRLTWNNEMHRWVGFYSAPNEQCDIGMARIFGGYQGEANTNRVVRTYDYMAQEYAMQEHFSIKSDVYSFGVLLLEIITSKRNNGYYPDSPTLNLIGHVWGL